MSPYLAATLYAWLSHLLGALLAPPVGRLSERALPLILISTSAALLFFAPSPLFLLALFAVLLAAVGPWDSAHRATLFLVAVACIPPSITTPIPIPLINNLLTLSAYHVAGIVLLAPLIFRRCALSPGVRLSEVCLALYVALASLIVMVKVDFTGGLRFGVEQSLALLLPFVALRRAITDMDDVYILLRGFVVVSLLMAGIALVASAKQWDFYRLLDPATSFRVMDTRSGFLRIEGVANTHSLGFHLGVAVILLEAMKERLNAGWIRLMLIRVALVAGLFFTDSRGAMGGLVVGYAAFVFFTTGSKVLRRLMLASAPVGIATSIVYFNSMDLGAIDPHGTFQYRIDLLETSLYHVLQNPLVGDIHYERHRNFQHLTTGLGIIDITNLYLLIPLNYGVPALVLFFSALILPLLGLLRLGRKVDLLDPEFGLARRVRAALVGGICGWLFLVLTTSDVGLTAHIGIVLAAISRAMYDVITRPAGQYACPFCRKSDAVRAVPAAAG